MGLKWCIEQAKEMLGATKAGTDGVRPAVDRKSLRAGMAPGFRSLQAQRQAILVCPFSILSSLYGLDPRLPCSRPMQSASTILGELGLYQLVQLLLTILV